MKLVKRTFSEIKVGDVIASDNPSLHQEVFGVAHFSDHSLVNFRGYPYPVRYEGLVTCVVSEVSEKGE